MYLLKPETQIQILQLLVEGNSISSICRFLGVHRDTCTRLMVRFARACQRFHNAEMRDLELRHIEIDELETYVRKKQMNVTGAESNPDGVGEFWAFMALDQDTRLIPAYQIDKRDTLPMMRFLNDLEDRLRLPARTSQNFYLHERSGRKPYLTISSDASFLYGSAIRAAFGPFIAYGCINKKKAVEEGKSTPQYLKGIPKSDYISTSLVERH